MKASTSPSYSTSSISTSCVVFILTTVIGNFGVSDADVALQQNGHFTLTSHSYSTVQGSHVVGTHDVVNFATKSFSPPSTFSESSSTTTATFSTPVDLPEYKINLLQNLRYLQSSVSSKDRTGKSTSTTKSKYPPTSPSSSSSLGIREQDQLHFRLLPYSAHRQSSPPSGLHTRAVRKVSDDEIPDLEDGGDEKIDIGYPLPLSVDDYWAIDKDRLLDQLVVRALANPEEWAKLRETLDKVDGDLKTLLSLERRKSQTIFDSSSINGSLGYSISVSGNISSDISKTAPSSSGAQIQKKNRGADTMHHAKFAYHRVSDLNAAGQPTSRGIAAVVSLDNSAESENGSKNESVKNKSSSLKAFSSENKPYSSLGANKMIKVAALTSSSKPFPSTSHSYGPLSSVKGRESSNSGNYNNNNNFRNSFSRLGNKEKYADLERDKNGGGTNDEIDDNMKSERISNNKNSKLLEAKSVPVIPPIKQSVPTKENVARSHEIQWESNLNINNNINAKQLNIKARAQHEEKELLAEGKAFIPQIQDIKVNYDDNNNYKELLSKRHHPARHHHHHQDRADDNFHKHHQFRKTELSLLYQNREQHRGNYHDLHYEPPFIENIGQHKHRGNHHQQHHRHNNDNKNTENFDAVSWKRFQVAN